MEEKLFHGAAYYPELWDTKTIEKDIQLMKETGINVVRMGEFAWSKLEPNEGEIDVSFFVKMINKLDENGIKTVMCTPTPTPPIWMSYQHPERMHVDYNGRTMIHGSRQHICTNNSYFRKRAAIITEELAKAIGHLPGLVAWQLDNEFKCHVSECMCSTCKELWHWWLKERYGSIEKLNEEWGTHIWSQYYQNFEQVPQPGPVPFLHNASLKTMYQLFSVEKITEFSDEQANIIRKYSTAPITHNSSIHFSVNNETLFSHLDFASFDSYATSDNYKMFLFNCDLWRNLKKDKEFWVMETSPSYSASLENYAKPHPNGYLKVEAVASYALGGRAFCYWLWRQQRTGCEQPHSSVISAWGSPTVGYPNILEVEKARKEIESIILNSKASQADIAITYSDRAKIFFKTEPLLHYDYNDLISKFYKLMLETGLHRDLIPENASLQGYKILYSPFIPYLSDEYLERARIFVENGGTWIVGPMSGGRTKNHTIHLDASLGKLEKMAGIKTVYTFPVDGTVSIGEAFGVTANLGLWSSVFAENETKSIGRITHGLTPGMSFITESKLGKGKVVMLGSLPIGEKGEKLLKELFLHYANDAKVQNRFHITEGTIVAPRETKDAYIWFVINMDGKGGKVITLQDGIDLLNKNKVSKGEQSIGSYQYRIFKFNK